MKPQQLDVLKIKSLHGNNLHIAGYASVFNVEDGHGDVITSGAFTSAINKRQVKLLWQHNQAEPIGIITSLIEDEKGLFIEAEVNLLIRRGIEAKALIEQGAIGAFSIGYHIKKSHFSENSVRVITEVDLWEVSLVTFPSNEKAVIMSVKENNVNHKEDNMNLQKSGEQDFPNNKLSDLELKMSKLEKTVATLSAPEFSTFEAVDTKFANFLRHGIVDLETKALSTTNDDNGGFMLRPELYNKIVGGIKAKSAMRQLASVETISSNVLEVLVEKENFVSNWVADAAARDDTNNAQVSKKRIQVHELYAQPKATQRLLDDSAINVEEWIAERLENSFSRIENAAFISGDGNNKPHGILHYGNEVVERVDVEEEGSINAEDILKLINKLDEYYLSNATFLMHRTTLSAIQNLRDGNDRFLWQASMSENVPGTLFGIPVVCSSDMPIFQGGNLSIILGDFKAGYKIVDKVGIYSLRDQYTEKPFIKFYTVKRVGGDVVVPAAIKVLKV